MTAQNQWQMKRAGVVNFWYYDEEIFQFADGKLLLRGSNGSGKSVTMQSFLPVLLDGKKSPDRLDPFGSKARKMEDYLLGEKEVTERDERTGYLFMEYKRKNTAQYITTGIGLRAKRHKNMDFWGFVITDNRRIGYDLFLYKEEKIGSSSQKVPLTKKELELKIGEGGRVVQSQKEYMELVNKYIFGFETLEAYDELIKLLIQLRSPKLSKDFKPTVIYGILENSLPELSDDELRPLSDTIENMDQTKQQLEQLERDKRALERLCAHYDAYNQYMLAEKAAEYVKARKTLQKKKEEEKALQETIKELNEKFTECIAEQNKLKTDKEVYTETKKQLEKHEVFDAEQEKLLTEKKLASLKDEGNKKEFALNVKEKRERQLRESIQEQMDEHHEFQEKMNELLEEMETDALEASFSNHEINAEDFKRHMEGEFDFIVWKKEAEVYEENLRKILAKWQEYNREKQRFDDASREYGEAQKRLDQTRYEERKWLSLFEEEKNQLHEAFIRWVSDHPYFEISEDQMQQTLHRIQDLYEPYAFEEAKHPFVVKYEELKQQYGTEKLQQAHQISILDKEIKEKKLELEEWKQKKDPEPPRHVLTIEARKELEEKRIPFVPFYQAVEFHDDVSEDLRERVESALYATGLLDALIVPNEYDHMVTKHDKIIQANPVRNDQHTLAAWLKPDLPESSKISKEEVEKVLSSIVVDGEKKNGETVVYSDGRYKIGLIAGHSPTNDAQFIGSQARERYRKQKIEQIQEELSLLQKKREEWQEKYEQTMQMINEIEVSFTQFPTERDAKEAFSNLQAVRHRLKNDEEEVQKRNEKVKEAHRRWDKIRYELNEWTKDMNIEANEQAFHSAHAFMQSYLKQLQSLQVTFTAFARNRTYLQSQKKNLEEVMEDIDSLKGELNILKDRMDKETLKLEQLQKRLQELGAEDIRRQIQEVTEMLEKIEERLPKLGELAVSYTKDRETAEEKQKIILDELTHLEKLDACWEELFEEEVGLRFVLNEEEEGENIYELAKNIQRTYADLLKKETRGSISEKLTKCFFQEQQTLVEYRLTEEMWGKTLDIDEFEGISEEMSMKWNSLHEKARRTILLLEFKGKRVSPYYVLKEIEHDIITQQEVLNETDRELYEEIILNSVGRILRARIHRAERWVKKINDLMEKRDTSSGLTFSIKWRPKTAEVEEEMDTKDLVDLLRSDPRLLKEEDMKRITNHFRSKITRARELSLSEGYGATLHQVIKEILDYRKWFAFTLYYKREGEPKRELTNHVFFTFSGGEKAMAMYIPLFSAAYSRYQEASLDAPYIISLDEAFAGVDENNIRDMFELVEELGFNYIMNSQALWGDYDTVSSLSICELVRPKNAPFVTVIRYFWNGSQRKLLMDEWEEEAMKV
ncbi:uncharacterized protein (TIGR02680 family) [Bacillus alveayuensis]|uniref:Uncharacterized protein (TIGR02680 family) n=2 Tax=Aeribacillus alveayuensis TaxID=279215 RepID=A0ABT9VRK9_9BACI|nr:uncharacterized protein (TIGR02680 family) [Bacillus alveayuensis]